MSPKPVGKKTLSFGGDGRGGLSLLPVTSRPPVLGSHARITAHYAVGSRYMHLELEAPEISTTAVPGQFLMLTVAHAGAAVPALPRPMAIYSVDAERGIVAVEYAVVGGGTSRLSKFDIDESVYTVGPLGRGFDIPSTTHSALLIGRGIGTCSLTMVAQQNRHNGVETVAVTSARDRDSVVGAEFYREHGVREVFEVNDEDGSSDPGALHDRLIAVLDSGPPQLILTCGSDRLALLGQKLATRWGAQAQVSLEAHMACGVGYCHGCASGNSTNAAESPLVCQDGPVFLLTDTTSGRI